MVVFQVYNSFVAGARAKRGEFDLRIPYLGVRHISLFNENFPKWFERPFGYGPLAQGGLRQLCIQQIVADRIFLIDRIQRPRTIVALTHPRQYIEDFEFRELYERCVQRNFFLYDVTAHITCHK